VQENSANKRLIIAATLLGAFWAPLLMTAANVALPAIGSEFKAAPHILSWVVSSTLLVTAMFVLPAGRISDIYGRKKIMLLGTAILTVTSLLCGLAGSVYFLIFCRSIQGIGAAMLSVTVISIVTSAFPPGERGKALGINVAATYIGLSASPFFSGLVTQYYSWRHIFFISVPIGLLLMLILLAIKKEWREADALKLDYTGSLVYAAAILAVIWGLTNLKTSVYAPFILLAGIVVLFVFVYLEFRVPNPLMDMARMKNNRVLVFSSLAAFINYSSTFAISYMMSLYLQYIKGISPQYTGMIMFVQPAFQAVFSPVAGMLSDKKDPQYVASVGMGLIAVCLFGMGLFDADTPLLPAIILLALIGTGFAIFSSPNVNSVMGSVAGRDYGIASGILATARTVGQSFSMAVSALIVSFYLGQNDITKETAALFVRSFKTTFFLFAALCFLGIWASLARGKREGISGEGDE
jgi:EmrB/QacA subfamily drug resistance transporter